jgi:cation diffusion facilitator CzcD-associated flavoprotein CzcO
MGAATILSVATIFLYVQYFKSHKKVSPAISKDFPIGIVGCGMSGIAMALHLKAAGFTNFTIFEQAEEVGGTWRENTYPGCSCDVPSHLYSISSVPSPSWTEVYSGQPEIWEYMRAVVKREGLTKNIKFGTRVESAEIDEKKGTWHLKTKSGEEFEFKVVVMATGKRGDD